jgi:hypothetical protein
MTTDSREMKNLLGIGLLAGLDLALEEAVGERASEPKDPRRGRDRLDQFLVPTLFKLGEDEFLCVIRSHNLGFRRSACSSEALTIWAILFSEALALDQLGTGRKVRTLIRRRPLVKPLSGMRFIEWVPEVV